MESKFLNKKIVITGGHLTPALAVLDYLLEHKHNNIIWIGHKFSQTSSNNTSAEYRLINERKIKFYNLRAGKLWRKITLKTFSKAVFNFLLIPFGAIKAALILLAERPKLIVSFGGYIALPVVIAAFFLRIKIITHEQTLAPGIANRIIARFSKKIMLGWESSKRFFPKRKTIYTGNPIREEVLYFNTNNYLFNNDLPLIYVTGGNQGANTINWRLLKILPLLLTTANVIHQTGNSSVTKDYENAVALKKSLPEELRARYIIREAIFGEEIGEVMMRANLILARAGANTVTEILALGKRAILIPIPWASGNEQFKNAKLAEQTGLVKILEQYDEMPPQELYDAISEGLAVIKTQKGFNNQPLELVINNAAKLININATEAIYDVITKQLN